MFFQVIGRIIKNILNTTDKQTSTSSTPTQQWREWAEKQNKDAS